MARKVRRTALKQAFIAAEKSQRQVAAEVPGLTENRLSAIVCGWIEPRAAERVAIAAAVGQPVDVVFETPDAEDAPRRFERPSPEAA